MRKLVDPEILMFGIGLVQILDQYAQASLDAQRLANFPTSVLVSIQRMVSKLEKWSSGWEWEDLDLKIAGIGNPSTHVRNLMNGEFTPQVSRGSRQAAANKINLNMRAELIIDPDNQDDFLPNRLTADDIVVSTVPVTGALEIKEEVEKKLEGICLSLVEAFQSRFKTNDLMLAVLAAYELPPTLPPSLPKTESDNWMKKKSESNVMSILEALRGQRKEIFVDSSNVLIHENTRFLQFWTEHVEINKNNSTADNSLENIYKLFCQKPTSSTPEAILFRDFFEHLQIRGYSEAIAETVGSVMNMVHSGCRNLHPMNFEKEVRLRFNLPPLHILLEKFVPELVEEQVAEKGQTFFRSGDSNPKIGRYLKYKTSSAVGNHRVEKCKKAQLPLSFFL